MNRRLPVYFFASVFVLSAFAQQPQPVVSAPQAPAEKPRVFITDSESWEVKGTSGGAGGAFASQSHGGARPQTAEIIKTFGERCPGVLINNRQEVADYVVLLDHEGGKGLLQHRNKVAVFEHITGDVVISHSTLSVGGSVEDACKGIADHWAAHGKEMLAAKVKPVEALPPSGAPAQSVSPLPPPAPLQATVTVDSTPSGADIEIDGAFVGNTPSTIAVPPGSHLIAVKTRTFADWTKTLSVTGGSIHLNAELDPAPARN